MVTKRSLILALWGLVIFVYLYYAYGESLNVLAAVCVVLPARAGGVAGVGRPPGAVELGLLRHPLRREVRPHLVAGPQHLAVLRCCSAASSPPVARTSHGSGSP